MRAEGSSRPRNTAVFSLWMRVLFVLLLGGLGWPVHAQVHPCSGPGPGEIMVGESPGGNGMAPTPLCQYVGDGGGQQQAPQPDVYMVVVTHPDTTAVWATAGYTNDVQVQRVALDACAKAMGEGCSVASTWINQATIVVVEDVAGNLFVQGNGNTRKAKNLAMDDCDKFSTGCRVIRTLVNGVGATNYFPDSIPARRLFASIARAKGTPPEPWDDKAWLASGQSGYKASQDAALAQCAHDTGMECEIRVTAGNGLVARALDDHGHVYWLNVSSPEVLERSVKLNCGKGRECRLVDTMDTRTPRTVAFDVSRSDAPARGFFSMARPTDDTVEKSWGKRALVTGSATRAEAQTAAVQLCEDESKSHCEAAPKDGDLGIEQELLLVRDSTGKPHHFFGSSADDVKQHKEKACEKDNLSCPKGTLFDLAKPVRKTVAF